MMVAFCIGAVIGSQIEKAIGVRSTLVIAALMFLGGFVGAGLFGSGSIAAVYLCYGVLGGLAVGIGYNSVIATTNMWFPDKVGFSSGVLMMGFGLGSLILLSLIHISCALNYIPTVCILALSSGKGKPRKRWMRLLSLRPRRDVRQGSSRSQLIEQPRSSQ